MTKEVKSILFTGALFIVFSLMALEANTFADKAKFFPFFVSIGAATIAIISVILQSIKVLKNRNNHDVNEESTDSDETDMKGIMKYIFWVIGYIFVIYILGFIVATFLFLLSFLIVESKFRIPFALLSTFIVIVLIMLFGNLMNLYWPEGLVGVMIFS